MQLSVGGGGSALSVVVGGGRQLSVSGGGRWGGGRWDAAVCRWRWERSVGGVDWERPVDGDGRLPTWIRVSPHSLFTSRESEIESITVGW